MSILELLIPTDEIEDEKAKITASLFNGAVRLWNYVKEDHLLEAVREIQGIKSDSSSLDRILKIELKQKEKDSAV